MINIFETQGSGTRRDNIKPGISVLVIEKHNQQSGKTTKGIVKAILTKSKNHHRGIKVRLDNGIVGRVVRIIVNGVE